MPASVRRIGIDEVCFRGLSQGLPKIRSPENPIHRAKNPGTLDNLIRDFSDISPSESVWLPAKWDIELSLAVEAHDTIKTCSIQEQKGKGSRLMVELIPNFI